MFLWCAQAICVCKNTICALALQPWWLGSFEALMTRMCHLEKPSANNPPALLASPSVDLFVFSYYDPLWIIPTTLHLSISQMSQAHFTFHSGAILKLFLRTQCFYYPSWPYGGVSFPRHWEHIAHYWGSNPFTGNKTGLWLHIYSSTSHVSNFLFGEFAGQFMDWLRFRLWTGYRFPAIITTQLLHLTPPYLPEGTLPSAESMAYH